MLLAIKAENDCRDVGRPSSCNASLLPHFLVVVAVIVVVVVLLLSLFFVALPFELIVVDVI